MNVEYILDIDEYMCVNVRRSAYLWLLWFPMFILNALNGASCDCSEVFAKQMAYTPATRKALSAKGCHAYGKTRKRHYELGSLRCAMLPANTKARSLYPNCFWGVGSGRGAQKLQTRSISDCRLSFMQLCYDQIATQQNQHLICVVCECSDYVRETTTQTKPTFWFVRLCVCSIA